MESGNLWHANNSHAHCITQVIRAHLLHHTYMCMHLQLMLCVTVLSILMVYEYMYILFYVVW